ATNNIDIYESEKEQRRYRFLAQSNERLVATQKSLNDAESAVLQLTDSMERAVVRSPVSGTVFQLAKRTIGEVIKPGETVLILFPEDDALTIEAQLQATDRDEVFVGQDVQVIFPSDQENQGLPVNGKLTYVSADSIVNDRNPAGSYVVKVKLPAEVAPEQMVPGNIAEVYIQTEAKTFMEIISEPFTRFAFKAFKG
ncbi:MAG: HlyD family efflux transporter periplasmic adaptor subunit, partial [Kordiimonas sp.]